MTPIDTTATETSAEETPVVAPAPTPEPEEIPAEPEPAPAPVPEPEPAPAPEPPVAASIEVAGRVPGLAADLPIIPERSEMNDLAAMAVMLAHADAVPTALRQKPNDVFLVLLTARDLGVSLTTALREFHVIEGKVTLSPKSKLAMVRTSGLGRIWPDPGNDAESATWHATRTDQPGERWSYTFTMAEAKAIKQKGKILADKDNWTNYPKRMLSWRAVGYLLDDIFPEVGTGLYSPDELGAVTNEEGDPIEVSAVEVPTGMRSSGGRQAPAVEAEAPDEATAAELAARLEAAKAYPEAHAELKAWWQERGLPPARVLTKGQAAVVLARLNALETKHSISRAEPEAEAPPAPQADPEAPEPGEVTETFAVEPPDDDSPAPTIEHLQVIADYAEAGEITLVLIERARLMNERSIRSYAAGRELEVPAGNLQALRRWWCETEIERISSALYGPILLAILGLAADPE